MRESKFRMWNVDANRWADIDDYFSAKKLIWQLRTGLKDRNGQEIYEGDLINFSWQAGHKEFYECKNQEVFYSNECASFVFGKDEICMLDRVVYDTLEVVGNVFENPELL
jgi:uncharacterized phage protein (TIGR01671 family)